MGTEQSRSFTALKVWFTLKTYGLSAFTDTISENIAQIKYLHSLIDGSPYLERISRSKLNVTCFRYITQGSGDKVLNEINELILSQIQTEGIAVPSHTIIGGKFLIRVANTNHRTEYSDVDYLVKEVLERGSKLSSISSNRHDG